MRFMFLGGRLDHTIRDLPTSRNNRLCPRDDRFVVPAMVTPHLLAHVNEEDTGEQVYRRIRVATDPLRHVWYTYVLRGHRPTTRDLLDACPQLVL